MPRLSQRERPLHAPTRAESERGGHSGLVTYGSSALLGPHPRAPPGRIASERCPCGAVRGDPVRRVPGDKLRLLPQARCRSHEPPSTARRRRPPPEPGAVRQRGGSALSDRLEEVSRGVCRPRPRYPRRSDRSRDPARSSRGTIPRADSPEHTARTGDPVDGVRVRVDALTVENGTQLPSVHVPILQQDSRHDQ